jgi:hypothetical protein
MAAFSTSYAWNIRSGGGGWSNGGLPINLADPTTAVWNTIPSSSTGTKPWDGSGMTTGFTDSANNIAHICSGSVCWRFDYTTRQWQGATMNGVVQPSVVDLSQSWSTVLAPAPDGTTLFSPNSAQGNAPGPVTAWTDSIGSRMAICNGRWCWNATFTLNQYISAGFERKNSEGKAEPYDICKGWGGNTLTEEQCQTQVNTVTPSAPTPLPPRPPVGDVTLDGVVNQDDYTLLVGKLYQTECAYNLTPTEPAGNDCLITIQDFNTLIGEMR